MGAIKAACFHELPESQSSVYNQRLRLHGQHSCCTPMQRRRSFQPKRAPTPHPRRQRGPKWARNTHLYRPSCCSPAQTGPLARIWIVGSETKQQRKSACRTDNESGSIRGPFAGYRTSKEVPRCHFKGETVTQRSGTIGGLVIAAFSLAWSQDPGSLDLVQSGYTMTN